MTATLRLSCDGEMLGSIAGKHALVELGLCTIDEQEICTFSVTVQPDGEAYEYGAREALRRPYQFFKENGQLPQEAAHLFIRFLENVAQGRKIELIFVNPGFDFAFIKTLLARYCADKVDLVGFRSYDITSYGCAALDLPLANGMSTGKLLAEAKIRYPMIAAAHSLLYQQNKRHNALEDALLQAELLRMLEKIIEKRCSNA